MKFVRGTLKGKSLEKKRISGQMSLILKRFAAILVVFVFLFALWGTVRWIDNQIESLKTLRFSHNIEDTFAQGLPTVNYSPEKVFTLLVVTETKNNQKIVTYGFVLIRIDMTTKKADIMTIHPDIAVPLQYIPGFAVDTLNLSTSRIKDLRLIGDLQTNPAPFPFFFNQVEELFALSIDGYIVFPADVSDQAGAIAGMESPFSVHAKPVSYDEWSSAWVSYWNEYFRSLSLVNVWLNRDLVGRIESNLSVVDVFSIARDLSSLPEDSVRTHIIPDSSYSKVIDERGETIKVITLERIDAMLSDFAEDERMGREQARVEVFNGTDINGWGSRNERWIKHVGAEVIRVKNAPLQAGKTKIYVVEPEKYPYTLERISSLFDEVEVIEGRPDFVTTGDLIVLLGVDF